MTGFLEHRYSKQSANDGFPIVHEYSQEPANADAVKPQVCGQDKLAREASLSPEPRHFA
jgi:hypothetical protein